MQVQQPQTAELFQTLPLEHPFAWKTESYLTLKEIKFVPEGTNLTISFTATRTSKIFGYIPIIGTVVGIYRIYKALFEHRLFNNTHLHHLGNRSINWIIRGAIELFPIVGGVICIIADIIATHLLADHPNPSMLPDATPCSYCHTCPDCCKC